jgi:hypothetical protein
MKYPDGAWYRTPYSVIVLPARRLWWRYAPGVRRVEREDLTASGEHDTLVLRDLGLGPRLDAEIPFFRASSARYVIPHGEATALKVQDILCRAMADVIRLIETNAQTQEKDLIAASQPPVRTLLFFLGSMMPKMKIRSHEDGVHVDVEQVMAIACFPAKDLELPPDTESFSYCLNFRGTRPSCR